jgi:hypothetical protein
MRRLNRNEISSIVGGDPRAIRAFERLLSEEQGAISGPSNVVIDYNADGTIANPLPISVLYRLVRADDTPITSGVEWKVVILSGAFESAIPTIGGTGAGVLLINSGLFSQSATIGITARFNGVGVAPLTVTVSKLISPPIGGSGGNTASDSTNTLLAFNSGSFAPITRELAVTLPSGVTTATLSAPSVALRLDNVLPTGVSVVEAKWQRESAPSVWSDVGAEEVSSINPFVFSIPPSVVGSVAGTITCNRSATGLAAGSAQKFRLVARVSSGNVRSVTPIGSASVFS